MPRPTRGSRRGRSVVPSQWGAEEVHAVGGEELAEAVEAEGFVDGGVAVELADLAEEGFHLAGGLVDVDDLAAFRVRAGPGVGGVAGDEDGFAGADVQLALADVEFELAVDHVDPLVLV